MDAAEFIVLTARASTSLMDIVKEPGVEDLTGKCRSKFALAVKAERSGDTAKAEKYLNEAVALEIAGA